MTAAGVHLSWRVGRAECVCVGGGGVVGGGWRVWAMGGTARGIVRVCCTGVKVAGFDDSSRWVGLWLRDEEGMVE